MTNEQLAARIKAGEDEAGNMLKLWQQTEGFIAKLAMKYQGRAEFEDLKQEGYIGLCEAVRQYAPDRGVPFLNYAAFWIRQAMRRYADNCCGAIRTKDSGAFQGMGGKIQPCSERIRKKIWAEPV